MKHLCIGKNTNRNCFPRYYHEIIRACGMSNELIARCCNISFRRLTELMYHKNTTMDSREFKAIKFFVENQERIMHEREDVSRKL
jgi:hypothetical protein